MDPEVTVEATSTESKQGKWQVRFEKWSFFLLLTATFLLPIFFFPSVSVVFSKTVLFSAVLVVLVAVLIFDALKRSQMRLPYNLFTLSALLVPVLFALSAFFSGDVAQSFFGSRFEIGTAMSVILGTILLFLTSHFFHTKDRVFAFFIAFFSSASLIALHQVIRLVFGPDMLAFGISNSTALTLIGKWNELGVYFGLVAILSLISLEILTLNKTFKTIWSVVLAIALFFLVLTNFNYVWIVVGLSSAIAFSYLYVSRKKSEVPGQKRVSKSAIIVFALALIFVFPKGPVWVINHSPQFVQTAVGKVANFFNAGDVEVRPSLSYTIDIAKESLKHNPIFGVGPNKFVDQWIALKPAEVNQTVFWGSDFLYGIGLVPTYAVTTGLIGILAVLFFLGMFGYLGFTQVFKRGRDQFTQYLIISSYVGALYLWIFQVVYIPSEVLFYSAFLFTGIFVACLHRDGAFHYRSFNYGSNARLSFVAVSGLIIILLGSVSFAYYIGEKAYAAYEFTQAAIAVNAKGDLAAGEKALNNAISADPQDVYYRGLVQLGVLKINAVLNNQSLKQEQKTAQISPLLATTLDAAQKAIKQDETGYQNWITLGQLYEGLLPFGYEKAYESAKQAYEKAQTLNTKNPSIILALARLEAANKNLPKAKEIVGQALAMKQNYSEAIYLLSQIQIAEGNLKDAIESVSAIAFLNQNDPTVFFQLGFLQYSNKQYADAVKALERAVTLNNQYSNARYFLGGSYAKLGRQADAAAQFEAIQKLNPDNQEVKTALANLKAGKDPLATTARDTSSTKEPTKKLPVKEAN
ncbi:MAG: tetratricopeptide repeat protein [bacterium]